MDKVFPNGIKAFKPHEKAPDFVLSEIVIDKTELMNWLKSQNDKVKLTLKRSQKGTYFLEVNTYVKPGISEDKMPF